MQAASESALERLLDSRAFTSLEKLSNVQSIKFEYVTQERDALDEPYHLPSSHEELLFDLANKIEHNYAAKTARVLDLGSATASWFCHGARSTVSQSVMHSARTDTALDPRRSFPLGC